MSDVLLPQQLLVDCHCLRARPSAGNGCDLGRLLHAGNVLGAFDSSGTIDLAMVGPLEVSMEQVLCVTDEGTVSALLGVTALKSTPTNTWGLSSVSGSPIRQILAPSPCSQSYH